LAAEPVTLGEKPERDKLKLPVGLKAGERVIGDGKLVPAVCELVAALAGSE